MYRFVTVVLIVDLGIDVDPIGFARIDHVPAYYGMYLFSLEFIPRVPPNSRVRAWLIVSCSSSAFVSMVLTAINLLLS